MVHGHEDKKNKGQILLIGLMVIALVTTIVGTGALRATTSTRTTKQTEEGNKASEIAKGLLEGFINDSTDSTSQFSQANKNATQVVEVANPAGNVYLTKEEIQKDATYTLYTSDYVFDAATETYSFQNPRNMNFVVYFGTQTGTCPALEITKIGLSNEILSRTYTYSCGSNPISGGSAVPATTLSPQANLTWAERVGSFSYAKTVSISADTRVVIIRPLFYSTQLGFRAELSTYPLPAQGREVSSTARTVDGAQRTEKVYQAYPQIPLDLFTTSF